MRKTRFPRFEYSLAERIHRDSVLMANKEAVMNARKSNIRPVHLAVAGLAIAVVVLAGLLWHESRTERVEFSFGGQSFEVEAEG